MSVRQTAVKIASIIHMLGENRVKNAKNKIPEAVKMMKNPVENIRNLSHLKF